MSLISELQRRNVIRVAMAYVALAVVYFAFDKFVLDPARDTQ